MSIFGNPVLLGGGGGAAPPWRDTLSVNWDFSDPVNTRGSTSYNAGSASGQVFTIDGWHVYGGKVTLVAGGLKLERYAAESNAYFMQRYKSEATTAMVGRTFTLSMLASGVLGSKTFTMPSGNQGTSGASAFAGMGVNVRVWNYGSEIAVTVDVGASAADELVQAIKLEAGDTQTLATQVGGVWVLNHQMDADTEYVRARMGVVSNS